MENGAGEILQPTAEDSSSVAATCDTAMERSGDDDRGGRVALGGFPVDAEDPGSETLDLDHRWPLLFDSFFRPQPWGGRRVETFFQRPLPEDVPYGEIWEISALSQHQSRVTHGSHRGSTLSELWNRDACRLTGREASPSGEFPLVLKWLECEEFASIQVHPDDALARQIGGGDRGKAEAWVVVHADETARVYAGLKPGTTRDEFVRNLEQGRLVDCLHSFVPQAGDCISIPAGTVHTTGGGVILAEVQQASDATFRLDDWGRMGLDGRPRPLQIEEALLAIDWTQGPVAPTEPTLLAETPDGVTAEHLLTTPYFQLDRYRVSRLWPAAHRGELTIWMVLDDEAELHGSGDRFRQRFHAGSSVMIPANAEGLFWTPTRPGRSATLLCVRLGSF